MPGSFFAEQTELSDEGLPELERLYDELDAEFAALVPRGCAACGECCRFDKADHILYASRLERDLLRRAVMPMAPDADMDMLARGLACPFQENGKCRAMKARTLGCRVHFCSAVENTPDPDFSERWHQRLKALHEHLGIEWDYRPLLPL
jgi:Fe-S-cluster containining protein